MLDVTKNISLPLIFFSNNVTWKLGIFNIFMAKKINIKKRNFQVLVFKSRRSLWGHAWCHKKYILWIFKGICMNFSLELKFFISSHPVTSKQPHKIVQILLGHPVWLWFNCWTKFGNSCHSGCARKLYTSRHSTLG